MGISFQQSTLTDIVVGMMSRSKSREKKTPAIEQGRRLEPEYERAESLGPSFEDDYGNSGYLDFRGYEFGEPSYHSFPRMPESSVLLQLQPSPHDAYQPYARHRVPASFGQPQHTYGYPGSRGSLSHGAGVYGEGDIRYDERRRFSAPIQSYDPYPGFQHQHREATSLPDIRNASVEEQIDELLEAVERSSLAESDFSGSLDGASEELERQLADMNAERTGEAGNALIECVALEDLPPVIQTIAIAREDARLECEDETGYEIDEIEVEAPMLVDLFELAKVLAQDAL